MSETLRVEANSSDAGEIEAAIARMMDEIERRREQIGRDQAEIDQLKA